MSAPSPRYVAVIDIGKTNAKVALVDLAIRSELASRKQLNTPSRDGPYPHHDVDAIWSFILDGLAALRQQHPIDAISVTTHGATAALLDAKGELVLPVLDYEFDGPDGLREAYEEIRPPFVQTGSPNLPMGLNLGAQLFWLHRTFPDLFGRASTILTYPQFWTRKLTGVAASEATSLGCHTDLWNPAARSFSSLVDVMGWRELFPPMHRAADILGPVLPDIASRIGLEPGTRVVCGIHDSNASLLPHLATRTPPFAVVSTGTWVVSMAVGGRNVTLDPTRDTLVNVNAFGDAVPSARFMGGREFETMVPDTRVRAGNAAWRAVLTEPVMLLPSVQQGSGPYPTDIATWAGREPTSDERFLAASFYLALMTATCLDLTGADGDVVVEGPFAGNEAYLAMLSAAVGRPVFSRAGQSTGASLGAALLAGTFSEYELNVAFQTTDYVSAMQSYARQWFALVAAMPTH